MNNNINPWPCSNLEANVTIRGAFQIVHLDAVEIAGLLSGQTERPYRVGEVVTDLTSHTTVRAVRHTAVLQESSEALMYIEQAYKTLFMEPIGSNASIHMRCPRVPPSTPTIECRSIGPYLIQA